MTCGPQTRSSCLMSCPSARRHPPPHDQARNHHPVPWSYQCDAILHQCSFFILSGYHALCPTLDKGSSLVPTPRPRTPPLALDPTTLHTLRCFQCQHWPAAPFTPVHLLKPIAESSQVTGASPALSPLVVMALLLMLSPPSCGALFTEGL